MAVKVFISQPMKDKSEEEILAERNKAIKLAKEKLGEEVEIIDSYATDYKEVEGVKNKPLAFLAKSIAHLANADVIVMCGDWHKYRGCRLEYQCAFAYDIKVIILE